MPSRKKTKPHKPPTPAGGVSVACWEDDPGDPKSQPALVPIHVPVPNQAAKPLPFKLGGTVPAPNIYQPGTREFLFYANACALRRTADFWSSIVPAGTSWKLVIICR